MRRNIHTWSSIPYRKKHKPLYDSNMWWLMDSKCIWVIEMARKKHEIGNHREALKLHFYKLTARAIVVCLFLRENEVHRI